MLFPSYYRHPYPKSNTNPKRNDIKKVQVGILYSTPLHFTLLSSPLLLLPTLHYHLLYYLLYSTTYSTHLHYATLLYGCGAIWGRPRLKRAQAAPGRSSGALELLGPQREGQPELQRTGPGVRYISTNTIYIYIHMCLFIYLSTYICVYMCTYICIWVNIDIYIYIKERVYYVNIYAYI